MKRAFELTAQEIVDAVGEYLQKRFDLPDGVTATVELNCDIDTEEFSATLTVDETTDDFDF